MKRLSVVFPYLLIMTVAVATQAVNSAAEQLPVTTSALPGPTPYRIVEAGPNHRIWQWETYESAPGGKVLARTHAYTELASGLNYKDPVTGQWMPSRDDIEAFSGGAISRYGQHQIIFANNLNSYGAIDMELPDGNRLRSNILGLMYSDPTTGQAVQIAQLHDSEGELVANNEVLYPNAFDGVKADVLFINHRNGVEQDVILREQLPSPASFGMDPATTEVAVFTEFLDPPAANVCDLDSEQSGHEQDQSISWGVTCLGRGRAFILGGADDSTAVTKRYVTIGGRHFLLEKVRLSDIQQALSKLPEQSSNDRKISDLASTNFKFPQGPSTECAARPVRLALESRPDKGYVLDYISLTTAFTNYTFQGDTTYYVSGTLNLAGTTTFEGGTVVKFCSTNVSSLNLSGPLVCQTSAYHPAVFTLSDDNTVGETISGSTGTPVKQGTGTGQATAIIYNDSSDWSVHDLRMSYLFVGVSVMSSTTETIRDCQFQSVWQPIRLNSRALTNYLQNVLINDANMAVKMGNGPVVLGEQLTVHKVGTMLSGSSTGLAMTNCLFINVTNLSTAGFLSETCATNASDAGIFQTAGGGSFYLAVSSPYRQAGTANIDPALWADITNKTTYPPVVYSNQTISAAMSLSPQALRDNGANLDLGYHYSPLDYCFGGVKFTTNITFAAGTAVGWFELPGSGGPGYGLGMMNGVSAVFGGTATSPCYFARYSAAQEGGNGLWPDKGWLGGIVNVDSYNPANPPAVYARYTHFSKPAGDSNHFRDGTSGQPLLVQATHCEFLNGFGGYNLILAFTNCLLDRASVGQSTSETYPYEIYQNCTFHGGSVSIGHWESGAPYWFSCLRNCAFDGTTFSIDDPFGANTNYAAYDYNAFLIGAAQPPTEGAHGVTVTTFNWQTNRFGNFYQSKSSPLIDRGSGTADQIGLFQFTTQTNQAKEGSSTVDIGYHYVAVDADGNPLDSNGDGIPDYVEDANGNGIYDAGETADWQTPVDNTIPAAWYIQNGLNSSDPLVGIEDADWDGLLNQQEYLYGTDPKVSEGFSIWVSALNGTTVIP